MLLQIMSVKKSLHTSMIMFTITVKNVSLFILMIFICSCCTHSSGLGVLVWNVIYTRYMYIAKGKCIWEGYTIPGRFLQLLPLKISVWSMSYKTCQNEKNKGKLKKKIRHTLSTKTFWITLIKVHVPESFIQSNILIFHLIFPVQTFSHFNLCK